MHAWPHCISCQRPSQAPLRMTSGLIGSGQERERCFGVPLCYPLTGVRAAAKCLCGLLMSLCWSVASWFTCGECRLGLRQCVKRRKQQHRPGIAPNANTTHVPTAGSSAALTKPNHTPTRHPRAKGKILLSQCVVQSMDPLQSLAVYTCLYTLGLHHWWMTFPRLESHGQFEQMQGSSTQVGCG